VCRLFPSIAPHGPAVPASVWNLPYGVWLAVADTVDDYEREAAKNGK
jgi:hypothetical protein